MESFEVAEQIRLCQRKLLEALGELDKEVKSKRHSRAMGIYEQLQGQVARTLLEHKMPTTIIRQISKESTSVQLEDLTQVEDEQSLIRSKIEVYKAVLNGWQSINRYLSEIPENQ